MAQPTLPQFGTDLVSRLKKECLPRINNVTIPIYGVQGDDVKRDRTGVLYKVGGNHFILTAAHKLRPIVEYNIPLYVDRMDDHSLPIPLAGAKFHCTEEEGRDVAAIRLPEDLVEQLLQTRQFLSHAEVTLTEESENSLYILFGYPQDWSGVAARTTLRSVPLAYVARRYYGERLPHVFFDARVHVVLGFDRTAISVPDGASQRLPRLHGVSGCGIWKVAEWSKRGLESWSPRQVSLVAIQHAWFRQSKYIQGTRVRYALSLIQDNYPDVSAAMDLVYPGR